MDKTTSHDPVNHPSHYQTGKNFEVMDIIEAYDLGFCDGNVIKYVLRWKNKDGLQDLKKALWYLTRMIQTVEAENVNKSDKVYG